MSQLKSNTYRQDTEILKCSAILLSSNFNLPITESLQISLENPKRSTLQNQHVIKFP